MENIRFHQGDVIGASIDAIPASAIMVKNRPLAISDRTKHAHVLTGNVERYEVDKRVIYKVNEESILQHVSLLSMDDESYRSPIERKWEDHKPIRLSLDTTDIQSLHSIDGGCEGLTNKKRMAKLVDAHKQVG